MNHTAIAAALRQIADALDEEMKPEAPVIAQPKIPEGYNPHKPGDPCPIGQKNWCYVAFRNGDTSEAPDDGARAANAWDWSDTESPRDIIGYKIVPSPELSKEEPKPEWPWKPEHEQEYYAVGAHTDRDYSRFTWQDDNVDNRLFAKGNVYRTVEEAASRAELDKRLAMTARLRQLGGGDDGDYTVRWHAKDADWLSFLTFIYAPGEARFKDRATADAAIETLRAAGLLPDSWS